MNIEKLLEEILDLSGMGEDPPASNDRDGRLRDIAELVRRKLNVLQQTKADVSAKGLLLRWMMNRASTEADIDAWKRLYSVINVFLEKYPGDLDDE